MRLKVSAKRIEAWNRYKLLPPKKVKRCTNTVFSPNQDKPVERLDLDKMETVERLTDDASFRQVDIVPLRNGDNFSDYGHDAPKPAPIGASERAKRLNSAYIYNAHRGLSVAPSRKGESPFKRKGQAKVTIIVKGKL